MNIYLNKNVYEAAKDRIRFVYSEFKNVVVNFSGGKDSTVVLHLALEVAEEMGRLPVNVVFFDQEAEWDATIQYIRRVMSRPDVNPMWYQIPFKINNASSGEQRWLHCWEKSKEDEWIRPMEENSIKTWNETGQEEDFYRMLDLLPSQYFNGEPVAALLGMRCQETPKRRIAITEGPPSYKWCIWCAERSNRKFDFDPIYDWEYSDVWKYINDNGFDYNKMYDYMYQYGLSINNMRISNVTHEEAIKAFSFMQEIEPDLYNRLTRRISGVSTASQMQDDAFKIKDLPFMFYSWEEYRDYLTDHLIKEEDRPIFYKTYSTPWAQRYKTNKLLYDDFCQVCIQSVMRADVCQTLIKRFKANIAVSEWEYWRKNGKKKYHIQNKYIDYELDNKE